MKHSIHCRLTERQTGSSFTPNATWQTYIHTQYTTARKHPHTHSENTEHFIFLIRLESISVEYKQNFARTNITEDCFHLKCFVFFTYLPWLRITVQFGQQLWFTRHKFGKRPTPTAWMPLWSLTVKPLQLIWEKEGNIKILIKI